MYRDQYYSLGFVVLKLLTFNRKLMYTIPQIPIVIETPHLHPCSHPEAYSVDVKLLYAFLRSFGPDLPETGLRVYKIGPKCYLYYFGGSLLEF